ncbi:ABC transporter permease [Methylobacterium sp. J-070]|uniref:ABC transporter permease n=1 Tax=Methylobacterium sp. J-070 TaxID=2836650 RepID=UPI001FBB86E8|nr:iron ABC transporter permease [Methylobacterium sp. J-070]MCJ2052897.1 iron ABC transporter permease [Methylobacterium sp. J-070]
MRTSALAQPVVTTPVARPGLSLDVAVPLLALSSLLGMPIALIATSAFNVGDPEALPVTEYGFGPILEIFEHLDWIWHSIAMSACATVLCVAIGVTLAWIVNRTQLPAAGLFRILITIPYPLGPLVGALAWVELAAPDGGLINKAYVSLTGMPGPLIDITSLGGIVFVLALVEAPVVFLMVGAAMDRMNPALEECASVIGANHWRTALRISLPLMMPAILSAAVFVFSATMAAFAIPAILGAKSRFYVVTTAIYVLFQGYPPNLPLASALGLLLIGFTALSVWMSARILRGRSYVVVTGKTYRPQPIDVRGWKPLLTGIVCLYVFLSLVLPLGTLLIASLQTSSDLRFDPSDWTLANYAYVILDLPTTRQAIVNSVILGIATGTIGVFLSTLLAIIVHRADNRAGRILEQVIMLPQAFPRLIFAFGFLWMILLLPFKIYGTLFALLLGYLVIFLPLGYRAMSGVVVQVDRALDEAAQVFGAGRARVLWSITLPLLRPGMVSTWALLFMVSIGEVSASIFLVSGGIQVLGPAVLNFWESGGLPQVSALVIVQSGIVLLTMLLIGRGTAALARG